MSAVLPRADYRQAKFSKRKIINLVALSLSFGSMLFFFFLFF